MSDLDALRQNLTRLRSPIGNEKELLQILSSSLSHLGIRRSSNEDIVDVKGLRRYLPEFQAALLDQVIPHWLEQLRETGKEQVLTEFFAPVASTNPIEHSWRCFECILSAYTTLTTRKVSQFSVEVLSCIQDVSTPLDLFHYLFQTAERTSDIDGPQRWNDYINAMFSVTGKATNSRHSGDVSIPQSLEYGDYLTKTSQSWLDIVGQTFRVTDEAQDEALAYYLSRLVSFGAFPPKPPLLPNDPSFWKTVLPNLQRAAVTSAVTTPPDNGSKSFHSLFTAVLSNLPISQQLSILVSLLSHLNLAIGASNSEFVSVQATESARKAVKRESQVLFTVLGDVWTTDDISSTWNLVSSLLEKGISEGLARVVVSWTAQSAQKEKALERLLEKAISLWCNEEHIRHSTLKSHRAITCLLLMTMFQLFNESTEQPSKEACPPSIRRLATRGIFIKAVGVYIEHADPSVRRCGMLVAEIVAGQVGSTLQFEVWDGSGENREWAREMRLLICEKDTNAMLTEVTSGSGDGREEETSARGDKHVPLTTKPAGVVIHEGDDDSDDSLDGYASDGTSSEPSQTDAKVSSSSKPTVEEINADPALLNPTEKKIHKPVYLLDLGRLFKVQNEGNEQCESIRVGLDTAPGLIRRKAGWGLELEENAVDLTCSLIGLQNNYDLENFERKVLEAQVALVACCPRKVAPCIIERLFTPSYSTSHRFAMLNALALGARELAGLPTPQIAPHTSVFPSRQLPAASHRKYFTAEDARDAGAPIKGLVEGISSSAIDKGRAEFEDKVPEIVREKQLSVRPNRTNRIVELDGNSNLVKPKASSGSSKPQVEDFTQVAAEFFIMPLVSQFWEYLQNILTHEERSIRLGTNAMRAGGTGMILSPLVLSHLINTMSILVHASRHSPAFLSVIAPAVLEMAVTLGTRRISAEIQTPSTKEDAKHSASVLSASLELGVVVLDASIDLDSGKSLALEHGGLVSSTAMWAQKAFSLLDGGLQFEGMGGEEEGRLRRASAGLVLKVEEVKRKWSQAMLLPF